MTEHVKCSVDSCHYWNSNVCSANEIEIAKNFVDADDMEAGMLGNNSNNSDQTKCVTFKPKG